VNERAKRGAGGGRGGADPLPVVNGLQQSLGIEMDVDLDALAGATGLRREILNEALDLFPQKRGATWEVAGGRIRMTLAAANGLLAGIGHGASPQEHLAAKMAAQGALWNRPNWRRMRVTNPGAGHRLVLGYLMDTGEGCGCIVPDSSVFWIGAHVAIQKAALASAPEMYELAEKPPRIKGRW